ncbi:gluconolactonase [Sphingobium sp. AP50]|nr:gluconolactonase [Sphingobium sp. AP50]
MTCPSIRAAPRNPVLAQGFSQPEGPVSLGNGTFALVEMGEERACVTLLHNEIAQRIYANAGGRPTGLALDGDGHLWVAGGPGNSLVRIDCLGRELLRVTGYRDHPFLFPNDLAFGPNGLLYMTDSGMQPEAFITGLAIRSDFATAAYRGCVYEIDPATGVVLRCLANDLRFANGIAFDAAGAMYVNETLTGRILRQELDGALELFAQVSAENSGMTFSGPDGMAFDLDGRLYCAIYGEGRVAVIGGDGTLLPSLQTNGHLPTNVAFCPSDHALLVTEVEHGAIEILTVPAMGIPLHQPPITR